MTAWRRFLPWACVLLAAPTALLILVGTSSDACGELPSAFADDVSTQRTEVLDGIIASTCQTREALSPEEVGTLTVVNWTGIIVAVGICAGAWLAGAMVADRVRRRVGLVCLGLSGAVVLGAIAVFFGCV